MAAITLSCWWLNASDTPLAAARQRNVRARLRCVTRMKPGWYVLAGVTLYAIIVTVLLLTRPARIVDSPAAATAAVAAASAEDSAAGLGAGPMATATSTGLWYPIPGAGLPRTASNLPGAERSYRSGFSQGFDFVDGDVAVPVPYGAAVLSATQGQVVRADTAFAEMDPRAWQSLLADVSEGATEEQLDQLRGRQLWIRTSDGTTLRYGHLSAIAPGLVVGRNVQRGQVIGFVGNSGTDDGVAGARDKARLRFEVWFEGDEAGFLGDGLSADEVRLAAASLFVGP